MKAIVAVDKQPSLVDMPEPAGDGVTIKVVSSSICGSDLHMLEMGLLDDRVIGHEFAGFTPDGTAVAVEPTVGCGHCAPCGEGLRSHCEAGFHLLGVMSNGGMAEYVMAPAENLVPLPLAAPDEQAVKIVRLRICPAVRGWKLRRNLPSGAR